MPRRASADGRTGLMALASLLAVFAACGCGGRDGVADAEPAASALGLFELALVGEPTDEQLRDTFHPAPDHDDRAALLDSLSALSTVADPRIVGVHQPAGPADAFVDIEAGLPGGGVARFTVRLRSTEPGTWRVSWFQAPGAEWPSSPAGSGTGLSSSAPPGTPR
jgi:hypothetical protein